MKIFLRTSEASISYLEFSQNVKINFLGLVINFSYSTSPNKNLWYKNSLCPVGCNLLYLSSYSHNYEKIKK